MAATLVEAAKHADAMSRPIIEIFAQESDLLRVMPFVDIKGNAYAYNVEAALPGVAFRGVNESYTESTGVVNPQTEALKLAGGDLDVDVTLVRGNGTDFRASMTAAKAKALSRSVQKTMIEGNSTTNAAEFDGLAARINLSGSQAKSNTGTAGALKMGDLDTSIDNVHEPTHLLMTRAARRLLLSHMRTSSALAMSVDEFGRQLQTYNGLPILIADKVNDEASIGNEETSAGALTGGSTSAKYTSIYCLSLGAGKTHGIQNGGIRVSDIGETDAAPVFRTRVEWMCGMVVSDPNSVSRLFNVSTTATPTN